MISFLPGALDNHPEATRYICRRFSDMMKHRIQQGKQHDNGKFKKVKKAIKRAMSENFYLIKCISQDNVDEDDLFADLMTLYAVHIRKSLLATILRVLGPRLLGQEVSSEDDTVVWKHKGDVIENEGDPYKVCRCIDAVGKTKLFYYNNVEEESSFEKRQERDYANASIFPGHSMASMAGVADDILACLGSLAPGRQRGVFQVALNLLETPWCSIQLVALKAPSHLVDVVSVPGASAGDMETVPDHMRAPLVRYIAESSRKYEKIANKVNSARDLMGWILEECNGMKFDYMHCKNHDKVSLCDLNVNFLYLLIFFQKGIQGNSYAYHR